MTVSESSIQKQIRVAVSQSGATVFRNNTGQLPDRFGRLVQFGLCKGSSDLIGWKSITITPEMNGKKIAVFLALEVKTATGKATEEQERFVKAVRNAGGFSGVVRTADEAVGVCNPLF
jgi:hypothetical protein